MSGCGKTTVTLGFMASLVKRGLAVSPFKVGPDFIDPGHHARIAGKAGRNLDGWMLSKPYNVTNFFTHARHADISVVEGVMGLFDGYDGRSEDGSTAQMAKWIGLPVLLVVDARSMARSAAALVRGFERFDPDITYAGVIFNNVGSDRHLTYLQEALEDHVDMPCLGGISRDPKITIPERHLGLVTREDHPLTEDALSRLADMIEKNLNVDALLSRLPDLKNPADQPEGRKPYATPVVRIGVPMDSAFCFYYADNLDILAACGAEIVRFSPLSDMDLPDNLDGIYLGGGYPELFAEPLSENAAMRDRIREKSMDGMPIYAECGGFMYLCREIRGTDGRPYPMAGCFPLVTAMSGGLKALGYREITFIKDTIIGNSGHTLRGHEFHYSELAESVESVETAYQVSARTGLKPVREGYRVNRTLGSYIHLHFGSRPAAGERFVASCLKYQQERDRT